MTLYTDPPYGDEPPKNQKKKLGIAATIGAMITVVIDTLLLEIPLGQLIGNLFANLF